QQHEQSQVAAEAEHPGRARAADVVAHLVLLAFDLDLAAVHRERVVVRADVLEQPQAEAGPARGVEITPQGAGCRLELRLELRAGLPIGDPQALGVAQVAHLILLLPITPPPGAGGLPRPRRRSAATLDPGRI